MKKGIHPDFHEVVATCHCGGAFKIGSTEKEVRVDMCSNCHPVFTGKEHVMADKGRVDDFKKRYKHTEKLQAEKKQRDDRKAEIAELDTEQKNRKRQKKNVIGKTEVA